SLACVMEVVTVSMQAMWHLIQRVATSVSAVERATVLASASVVPPQHAATARSALLKSAILRTADALLARFRWERVAEFVNRVRPATQPATAPEETHYQVVVVATVFRVALAPMALVSVEHSFQTELPVVAVAAYVFPESAVFRSRSNGAASQVL